MTDDAAMSARRVLVGGLVLIIGASGCSLREHPTACRVTSAAIGVTALGVAGGLGVAQLDLSDNTRTGAVAASAAGGAAIGAVVGFIVGKYVCEAEPPPAPPPAPVPPPPPAAGTKILTLEAAHFAFDRYDLTPEGRARVDEAAKIMTETPSIRVAVDGYTDAIGSEAYNLRLSERRAATVRGHLVSRGIAPDRITTHGYGKSRSIASNETAEGRARNRRVEIVVQ
jgi:OmpA-OmpF porin, OOP family